MTNIEKNALRIAELLGYRLTNETYTLVGSRYWYYKSEIRDKFSSYAGLMPIIESEISEYELKAVHFELEGCGLLEAVQKYVIKYLELKNESRNN